MSFKLNTGSLENYLSTLLKSKVKILSVGEIGKKKKKTKTEKEMKGFGYGAPYLIELKANGKMKSVVFETMKKDSFGHDFLADRAQSLILA
ncbi:MAG: hypothetical protein ABIH76_01425, partial [Candidatus Bathyarchaeota archaeon]